MLLEHIDIDKIVEIVANNLYLLIFIIPCIIEIIPIKVNPWSSLFSWISKFLTGHIESQMIELESDVKKISRELAEERVQRVRWNILNFTNSCRQNHIHTKEEWDHALEELTWYEDYCKENDILNGVIFQSAEWLKSRYTQHLENDDFLKN